MEIDLQKLGLTEGATLAEIQAKLNTLTIFSQEEVTDAKDAAAAGSRSAADSKWQKKFDKASKLSVEDQKILDDAKSDITFKELRKDETLAKFSDVDFKLIVKAEGLAALDDDARTEAIKGIATSYADKMSNGLPPVIKKDATPPGGGAVVKPYAPGSLGLMVDNDK